MKPRRPPLPWLRMPGRASRPHAPRAIARHLRSIVGNPYAKMAALAILLLAASACGSGFSEEAATRQGFDNFQTAVASDRNYDVYWMGREFTVGGFTYTGPSVPEIGGMVDGGGMRILYISPLGSYGGSVDVEITLYSKDAWVREQARRAAGPQARFDRKSVDVNDQPTTLETRVGSAGKVTVQRLVIEYGRTVAEATTGSIVPRTPGPEPNPLIDEDTFLAAMQNLRPYPE